MDLAYLCNSVAQVNQAYVGFPLVAWSTWISSYLQYTDNFHSVHMTLIAPRTSR